MRLFHEATALMTRPDHRKYYTHRVPQAEKRKLLTDLGDSAYCLYDYYCTAAICESTDLTDNAVAEELCWTPRKVAKYRVMLQKGGYVTIRNLTDSKSGKGYVHCILGLEKNALFKAGLPYDTRDMEVLNKAKKQLGIAHPSDVVDRIVELTEVMQRLLKKERTGE